MCCFAKIQKVAALLFAVLAVNVAASSAHDKLSLNGMALLGSDTAKLYLAALYVEVPTKSLDVLLASNQLKRMELFITVRHWRESDIHQYWQAAVQKNNDFSVEQSYREDFAALTAVLKGPLVEGDRVHIDYSPKKSTLAINGVQLLTFKKPEFFHVLLRTWLGPNLPDPSVRPQLAGIDTQSLADLKARAAAYPVRSDRRLAMMNWLDDEAQVGKGRLGKLDQDVAKNLYRVELTRAILRQVNYPVKAQRAGEEGTVLIAVRLSRRGSLLAHSIQQSSGVESLDHAALQAIERSQFTPFPATITDDEHEFLIPVSFVLSTP